jgi:hypothetical protein
LQTAFAHVHFLKSTGVLAMTSLQEVSDQFGKLKFANAWLVKSEVRQLPMILAEGEQIVGAIQGTWSRQNALAVATERRLILMYKGLVRLAFRDFALDQITSVECEAGWAFGSITIYSAGHKTTISKLTAAETRPFADVVRSLMSAVSVKSIEQTNCAETGRSDAEDTPSPSLSKLAEVRVADLHPAEASQAKQATAGTEQTPEQKLGATNSSAVAKRNDGASALRNVSVPLGIGITFVPALFVWFLLRRGHSKASRFIGFGWAGFLLLVAVFNVGVSPPSDQSQVSSTSGDGSRQSTVDDPSDLMAPWPEAGDGVLVTKSGFVRRNMVWPLTIDTAVVGCKLPGLLWVEAEGTRYGLNGMGQIHLKLDRFDDIWAADSSYPSGPGGDDVRLNPSDLLDEARKRCGQN